MKDENKPTKMEIKDENKLIKQEINDYYNDFDLRKFDLFDINNLPSFQKILEKSPTLAFKILNHNISKIINTSNQTDSIIIIFDYIKTTVIDLSSDVQKDINFKIYENFKIMIDNFYTTLFNENLVMEKFSIETKAKRILTELKKLTFNNPNYIRLYIYTFLKKFVTTNSRNFTLYQEYREDKKIWEIMIY